MEPPMINAKLIDELANRLSGMVPEAAKTLQGDLEKNMRAALQGTLKKMDLVTREEFDVQSALLQRSQARLKELEAQIKELEARILK